jgi:chemotaxis protein MotA
MAVALLTTLYGALIANLVALPIADKLELRGMQERVNKLLIIETMSCIQQGQNPRLMDEVLEAYIPRHERERLNALLEADKARSEPEEGGG